jgi:hypothetical protein
MSMRWKLMKVAVFCFALSSLDAHAQSTDARVVGKVMDETSGVPVGGVEVQAVRGDTVAARTESNAGGEFVLPSLGPGVYRLEASHDGFTRSLIL